MSATVEDLRAHRHALQQALPAKVAARSALRREIAEMNRKVEFLTVAIRDAEARERADARRVDEPRPLIRPRPVRGDLMEAKEALGPEQRAVTFYGGALPRAGR